MRPVYITMEPLVIALAGATCSGKSTLSERLSIAGRHSIAVHQDDFYHGIEAVPWSNGQALWDDPRSIDWNQLIKHVKTIYQSPTTSCKICKENKTSSSFSHLIIVEGTMLCHSRELLDMCCKSFFIALDYETCSQRRQIRYCGEDGPNFFDEHVWPMYCEMERKVHTLPKVTILNGIRSLEEIERDINRKLVNC